MHGDAEPNVGGFDGHGVVGDDEELGAVGVAAEGAGESLDVAPVERGVHFVEDDERGGLDAQESEEEGDGAEGAFAAAQEFEALATLSGEDDINVETGLEGVVGVGEADFGAAFREEVLEGLAEVALEFMKGFEEPFTGLAVEFGDAGTEFVHAGGDVFFLGGEFGVPFGEAFVCVDGAKVDFAHGPDFAAQRDGAAGGVLGDFDSRGGGHGLLFGDAELFDQSLGETDAAAFGAGGVEGGGAGGLGEGVHAGGDDGAFAFLLGASLGGFGAIGGEGGNEGVEGLGGGALIGFALGVFGDGGEDALTLRAEIGRFAALEGDGFFDLGEATLGFDVTELGLGRREFGFGESCAHAARFRAAGGEFAHEAVAFGLEFDDVGGASVFFADTEEVVALVVQAFAGAERALVFAGDAGEPVLGFAEFGPCFLLFVFEGGDVLSELFPLGGEFLGFAFKGAQLFAGVFEIQFQFVEFGAALEDAGALVFCAAAGDSTGAMDDFSVEGDEAVPALGFGEGEGNV